MVLYETTSRPALGLTDDELVGGWVYYAIFLYNSTRGAWERAGTTDALVSFDFGSTDKLWNLIPDYYRQIRDNGAGYNQGLYQINPAIYLSNEQTVPNLHLLSFLHVIGFSFDRLRSEIDTILDAYDPRSVHQKRLGLLAEQFGGEIYADVPAQNNRSIVRNLSLLYRKRGTISGLRELLELATGYDIDVTVGKNMMLSEDQAEFTHPQIPWWDATVRYEPGDLVRYGLGGSSNYYFAAKQVAYGKTQAPELGAVSNAYWDHDRFLNETDLSLNAVARRLDTGDVSTWQIREVGGNVIPERTWIGMGRLDPVDGTLVNTNALAFVNTSGSTKDIVLRSIPVRKDEATVWNKRLAIESGIPVPRVPGAWSAEETYEAGSLVYYRAVPYEALLRTSAVPTDTTAWKRLGLDERIRLNMSMYVHGKFAGTAGAGSLTVHPHVMLLNESGDLISEVSASSTEVANVVYDPFYDTTALSGARVTPMGGQTWTAHAGTWTAGFTDNGYFRYPSSAGRVLYTVAGLATGNVGLTFNTVGSRDLGVVFRYLDTSNFWMALDDRLVKVVAGAITNPASGAVSWTPFVAGERMTVSFSGSNITVKKNGVTVGTATDSFQSTATRVGVVAEA